MIHTELRQYSPQIYLPVKDCHSGDYRSHDQCMAADCTCDHIHIDEAVDPMF